MIETNESNMSLSKANMTSINIEMPIDIIIVGSFFYSMVFLVGIVGNLSVIYVLLKERSLRNFTNYLLANLSIADLLVLIACVPSGLHDLFAKERWYLGEIWCYMVVFIENCMGVASLLSIFSITMERFYVICRPLKVKSVMTQSRTLKLILLIWVVSISINLPFIYLTEYRLEMFFDKNTVEHKCITRPIGKWSFYYIIIVTYVMYFVIGLVLLGMYYKITKYLRNSMNIMASTDTNKKSTNNLPATAKRNSLLIKSHQNEVEDFKQLSNNEIESTKLNINSDFDKYTKPRRQLIMMLMCVIVGFYVCLFPLKIWTLILMFIGHQPFFLRVIKLRQYWYISIVVRFFFYANSSINPILYNFMSKKFRKAFKSILLLRLFCYLCPSESDQSDDVHLDRNESEFKRSSCSKKHITNQT